MTARAAADDWFAQVKAWPVAEVANRFGLEVVRHGNDVSFACPVCSKELRHSKTDKKRRAAKVTPTGGWHCFECEAGSSALDLALAILTGKTELSAGVRADVRRECAHRGLCQPEPGAPTTPSHLRYVPPPPKPSVTFAPKRLPVDEVEALWCSSIRLDAVPSWDKDGAWCGEARTCLSGRGLNVAMLSELDAARILPPADRHAWPAWWRSSWSATWRAVVRLYDAKGAMVAVQARAIVPLAKPKTMNPKQQGALMGTFFADSNGLELLRGTYRGSRAVLVEGLTDFLSAAQLATQLEPSDRPAVLGIVAGSAQGLAGSNVYTLKRLDVLTDNDTEGERYFKQVREALPQVNGLRIRLRPLGDQTRSDFNDHLRHDPARALGLLNMKVNQ